LPFSLGRVEHFDHGTDSDYFLGDSMLKIISLVILSAYF